MSKDSKLILTMLKAQCESAINQKLDEDKDIPEIIINNISETHYNISRLLAGS